ncbi:hypothetical protein ACI2L1_23025 [Streptomyces sp. NPDC019531]|uniref:hypothetical protein n=1 Tax=Streptomyces sp. NPDC019531 TaxID=3365062 RepID=UPI0038503056
MTDETSPEQSAFHSLTRLAEVGVKSPQALEQSSGLERLFLALLGVDGRLSYGSRRVVLEELLSRVADDARRRSLRRTAESPFVKQREESIFQVAAAGEILGLTDEESFKEKYEKWCGSKSYEKISQELKNKGNEGSRRGRQVRAGVWFERSRSCVRGIEKDLIKAFESELETYIVAHRKELKVFVTDHLESAVASSVPPAGFATARGSRSLAETADALLLDSGDRDVLCTTPEQPPQSNSRTASNTLHELPNRREPADEGESGREQASDSRIHIWRQTRDIAGIRKTVAVFIAGALLALTIVIISWSVGNGESSVSGKGPEMPASGNQASTGKPVLDGQPCLAGIKPEGDEPEVLDFQLSNGTTSTPCSKSVLVPITESTRKRPQVSRYAIQSGANTFHATLHVSSPFGASVEFKASTNNSSETHTISTGEEKEVSIPVAGAQTVELTTTIRDVDGKAVGYAVWGNAQFLP